MMNVTNIHHLALFICHLFIDGHFRTAYFLYSSNAFDFDLLSQIDAICPEPIPLYLTDITSTWYWPWNQYDNPDNTLQFNFFDPNIFTADIAQLDLCQTYYCVFCVPSTDLTDPKQRSSIFTSLRHHFSTLKILLVDYNAETVSVLVDSNSNSSEESILQPIFSITNETNFEKFNLFDRTFGELERMQSIAIHRVEFVDKSEHGNDIDFEYRDPIVWMHFYHLHLNNSFINMAWIDDEGSTEFQKNQQCVLQSPDYYKELSYKYQCVANGSLSRNDHTIGLHMLPQSFRFIQEKSDVKSLYAYHSFVLKVIFLYGTDYKREIDIFNVSKSKSIKIVAALIVSVLIMAIIILFAIRKRFNLPGNDIVSCIVDCVIPFIGGGSLRMEHRFERWFFGVLIIGAFFIMSVFGGDLVDSVVRVLVPKVVTFEDLVKINPPIYLDSVLYDHYNDISEMLRTKMGTNTSVLKFINGEESLNSKTSYVLIPSPDVFELLVGAYKSVKRDYDIVEEPLGEIFYQYMLMSNQYLSERITTKFDNLATSMGEFGFYRFYQTFLEFKAKRMAAKKIQLSGITENEIDLEPIVIDQFKKPIIIFLYLNGVAAFVFVAEILIFKWLKWRNCRVQILPLVKRQPKPRSQLQSDDLTAKHCQTAPPRIKNANRKNAKQQSKKRRSASF